MTPARAVRDRAEALLRPDDEFAVATDTSADPVLIGVATRKQSLVIAVAAHEYDGLVLAELLGWKQHQPTAMERLRNKKAA